MKPNENISYQMNANNNQAMYMYMMQCMMMNANRNMIANNNTNQQFNQNFSLGYNQPYRMNPNNIGNYYQMSQRPNDTNQFNNNNVCYNYNNKNNYINKNNNNYNRPTYQNNIQMPQSKFSREIDFEFDLLAKKREREVDSDQHKEFTKEEMDDINKWLEQRRKNYPSKENIERKQKDGEIREERGMISQLELKLRKKNNLLKRIDGRPNRLSQYNNNNNNNQYHNRNHNHNFNQQRKTNQNNNNKKPLPSTDIEEGEVIEDEPIQQPKDITPHMDNHKEDNGTYKSNSQINKKLKRENKKNKPHRTPFSSFKYKKNKLYDMMLKQEKIIEDNILLQAFRYFSTENLI